MRRPYYERAGVTIYHARAEDVLPSIPAGSLDLVVTSPPYNMGLVPGGNGRGMYRPGASNRAGRFRDGYGEHNDALEQGEYDNHRPRIEHGKVRLPLGFDFGYPIGQILTWDRSTGIGVNLRRYCSAYEWIVVLAKPEFRLVDHSASGLSDMWRLGMEHQDFGHPAPFPVSLPLRALTTTGAQSVADPFLGSGSTLIAAQQLGIRAIGIEREERFCEIAANRLERGDEGARHLDQAPLFSEVPA